MCCFEWVKRVCRYVEEYGSDAMRFALADAGDTIEDANFVDGRGGFTGLTIVHFS
jgi:hypothetical protein